MDWGLASQVVEVAGFAYGASDLLFARAEVHQKAKLVINRFHLTRRRVDAEINRLVSRIEQDDFKPTLIVGLGGGKRIGGYFVGTALCTERRLGLPFLPLVIEHREVPGQYKPIERSLRYVASFVGPNDSILIVDDLCKRGDTIRNTIDGLIRVCADQRIRQGHIRVAAIARYTPKRVMREFGSPPVLPEEFWKRNFYNHRVARAHVVFPWEV